MAPLLMHCGAAHVGLRAESQAARLPVFGNEATRVQSANRLAATDSYTCAVLGEKRTLRCWGPGIADPSPVPMMWAPESNEILIEGAGPARRRSVPSRAVRSVRQIVLKDGIGCALLVDSDVVCWELFPRRSDGGLAHAGITMADPLLRDSLRGAARIVTDGQAWCALRVDQPASCFGGALLRNALRRLGDVVDVSGGGNHSCVLRANGKLLCWGDNDHGQLGVGDALLDKCIASGVVHRCTDEPSQVPLVAPATQFASDSANCALLQDGTVHCWGPWGPSSPAPLWKHPRRIAGLRNVVQVSLNGSHGCALREDGLVYCFGQRAATATGSAARDIALRRVTGIENARELAVGREHACVVLADRSVWCWGENNHGQLGDGSYEDRSAPIQTLPPHSVSPPIMK